MAWWQFDPMCLVFICQFFFLFFSFSIKVVAFLLVIPTTALRIVGIKYDVSRTFMHSSIHVELSALATVLNTLICCTKVENIVCCYCLGVNMWVLLEYSQCVRSYTLLIHWKLKVNLLYFLCSPRTSTLSYIASGTAIALTTMKRKGRRRAVRLTNAHTRPRSWSVWRPSCTTNRDTLRRSRWRRREYKYT